MAKRAPLEEPHPSKRTRCNAPMRSVNENSVPSFPSLGELTRRHARARDPAYSQLPTDSIPWITEKVKAAVAALPTVMRTAADAKLVYTTVPLGFSLEWTHRSEPLLQGIVRQAIPPEWLIVGSHEEYMRREWTPQSGYDLAPLTAVTCSVLPGSMGPALKALPEGKGLLHCSEPHDWVVGLTHLCVRWPVTSAL